MTTFSSRKGLVASLENIAPEGPVVIVDDVTNFMHVAEVPLQEVMEVSVELDYGIDGLDEAVSTIDTLSEMNNALTGTLDEEGGLSQPVADALRVAVEHFSNRLGFSSSKKIIPAMEDYEMVTTSGDQKEENKTFTKTAIDNIVAVIKRIWQAILNSFQRMMEWLTEFFQSFTYSASRLKARSIALRKKAENAKEKEGVVEEITERSTGFAKHLKVDGKALPAKEFVASFLKHYASQEKESKSLHDGSLSLAVVPYDLKNAISNNQILIGDIRKIMQKSMITCMRTLGEVTEAYTPSENKDFPAAKGTILLERPMTFGGVSKFAVIPAHPGEVSDVTYETLNHFKSFIAATTGSKPGNDEEFEIESLSLKQIQDVSRKVTAIMTDMSSMDWYVKRIKVTASEFKRLSELVEKKVGGENAMSFTQLSAAVSKLIMTYSTSFVKNSLRYDLTLCAASLDYCAISLRKTT